MHTTLPARIAQLSTIHVASVSPKQLKADILDLVKYCQVLPEQNFLLRVTARDMTGLVQRVFGSLAMIFPLTETGRRHVYLAVLAKLDADNRIDAMDDIARIEILVKLLTWRNADLISDAYGSNPKGFLRLLTSLGDVAREKQFYLDLHGLLNESPEIAAPLCAATGGEPLSDVMLEMIMFLPRSSGAVALARHFPDRRRLESFLLVYKVLTGGKEIKSEHLTRIGKGENPVSIVEEIYQSCVFPEAQIPAHPQITHLRDGKEMSRAAKMFRNCLHFQIHEALHGERQYYVWSKPGAAEVVFAIQNDTPYGWYLIEAKHKNNEPLHEELERELQLLLHGLGVKRSFSLGQHIRDFFAPSRDDFVIPF